MVAPLHIPPTTRYKDALDDMRGRDVLPSESFYALPAEVRARAFTITGAASMSQARLVMDRLYSAIESGSTFEQFKQSVKKNEVALDLPKHRIENIFRTNIQSAYSHGRYMQEDAHKARRPIRMYDAINDSRTRPAHRAMDGFIAPVDDPIWKTHLPLIGYQCRCSTITLTEAQAKARGYVPGNKPPPEAVPDDGWDYDKRTQVAEGLRQSVQKAAADHGELGSGRASIAATKAGGKFLSGLENALTPADVADVLRDKLGAKDFDRYNKASRHATAAYRLSQAEGVALSAYTDRAIGNELINPTARAMYDAAAILPDDFELAALLISAVDSGLQKLPAAPGIYWRGVSVRGSGPVQMPEELAARWEDAHRPGRVVQHFGYTSVMASEGRQFNGDWQMAIRAMSARDLAPLSLAKEPALIIPRKVKLVYTGLRSGYRLMSEADIVKEVKQSRRFASEPTAEQRIEWNVNAGFARAQAEQIEREFDATLAQWEQRKKNGGEMDEDATRRVIKSMTDEQFAGAPGYSSESQ